MKITGVCELMMTALVVSSFSTAAVITGTSPELCKDSSDPNVVCEVTDNGLGTTTRCIDGYTLSQDSGKCVLNERPVTDPGPGAETCRGFSDPNAVCEVTNNGWGKEIRCHDGYILSQDSGKCVLDERPVTDPGPGAATCRGFSDPNGVCEVTDNGWGRHIHCLDGYIRIPYSANCVPENPIHAGPFTCEGISAANADCEVVENGWNIDVRCRVGYIPVPDSDDCILEDVSQNAQTV